MVPNVCFPNVCFESPTFIYFLHLFTMFFFGVSHMNKGRDYIPGEFHDIFLMIIPIIPILKPPLILQSYYCFIIKLHYQLVSYRTLHSISKPHDLTWYPFFNITIISIHGICHEIPRNSPWNSPLSRGHAASGAASAGWWPRTRPAMRWRAATWAAPWRWSCGEDPAGMGYWGYSWLTIYIIYI